MVDDESEVVVEEVLTELEHNLTSLMNTMSVRSSSRNTRADAFARSTASRRLSDHGEYAEEHAGARRASREHRRSSRGDGMNRRRSSGGGGGRARAAGGNTLMAGSRDEPYGDQTGRSRKRSDVGGGGAALASSSSSPGPSPRPVRPPSPPDDRCHDYDDDVNTFLEYMARAEAVSDVFHSTASPDDEDLRDRLLGAMDAAIAGRLSHWELDDKSVVALVILLDQIPRRAFPSTAQMYVTLALVVRLPSSALRFPSSVVVLRLRLRFVFVLRVTEFSRPHSVPLAHSLLHFLSCAHSLALTLSHILYYTHSLALVLLHILYCTHSLALVLLHIFSCTHFSPLTHFPSLSHSFQPSSPPTQQVRWRCACKRGHPPPR
jgi:uncharacterized protein (DUF924 family)